MRKHYTFETLGMSNNVTVGVAQRVKTERYGKEHTPDKTFQYKFHIGKVSVYVSRRKTARKNGAKELGGHNEIGYGELKDKLIAMGVMTSLLALGFADSLN